MSLHSDQSKRMYRQYKKTPSSARNEGVFYDKSHFKNKRLLKSVNALAAFLLQKGGAREKLTKENAVRGISLSAESEEGFAPSTAQAFEKA